MEEAKDEKGKVDDEEEEEAKKKKRNCLLSFARVRSTAI